MTDKVRTVAQTDPLIKAARKAYKGTVVCALDELLAEESRWKRKATIAANKLAWVRGRINDLAEVLAQESVKGGAK